MIIKGYLFAFGYVLAVILLSLIAYKLGMQKKYTRKLIHIMIGFVFVILNSYIGTGSLHFLAVCLVCLLLLAIDHRRHLLPHMSSDGDNSPGTVYYAVSMSIMALASYFAPESLTLPFGIAVFCTSLGDGLAGVVGQAITRYNPRIWRSKSLYGTVTNLLVSSIGTYLLTLSLDLPLAFWHCAVIGVIATVLELVSSRGLDNVSLPLGVFAVTAFMLNYSDAAEYIAPIILIPVMIALVLEKKLLTPGGTVMATLLGTVTSVSLGNFGFLALLTFFAVSTLTDKIKKSRDKAGQNKKRKPRNAQQVIANGILPLFSSVFYIATGDHVFLLAYVATLSEALADTASSSVGSLSSRAYDIFRLRRCAVGESGGMSLLGTLTALVASSLPSFVALFFGVISPLDVLLVSLIGFIGSIADSLFGSILQGKFICSVCNMQVETPKHCGEKTKLCHGLSFVNNSTVNFISALFTFSLTVIFL